MWEMSADQLERYRRSVDDDAPARISRALVASARHEGLTVMGHGELKTAPRGFPKDHPRIELLRYKGLVAWREWPVGRWLGNAAAKDRIVEFFCASRPVVDWLGANVGPPEQQPRR